MNKKHDKNEKIQVVTKCEDCIHRHVCPKGSDIAYVEDVIKSWHSPTNERITIESHYDVNIIISCPHYLHLQGAHR